MTAKWYKIFIGFLIVLAMASTWLDASLISAYWHIAGFLFLGGEQNFLNLVVIVFSLLTGIIFAALGFVSWDYYFIFRSNDSLQSLISGYYVDFHRVEQVIRSNENVDINKEDPYENTPLIWAIRARNVEIVKLLVDFPEIDVNKADKYGKTPLTWAIEKGNIEILELLLKNPNIDVNKAYKSGKTPLTWAIEKGNTAIAKLLLKHENIEVNKEDPYENTPLIWAIRARNVEIVKLLVDFPEIDVNKPGGGANQTPLMWAIEKRNTAIAKLLIQSAEIDVNKPGGYAGYANLTPLIWAIENRNTAIAKLLIQSAEIDVNKPGGGANQTPLIWAIKEGNIEIIELLLKNPNIAVNDYHFLSMAVYRLLLLSRSTEETVNCFNCVDRIMSHRDVEVPQFRIIFNAHYSLTHRHLAAPKILRDFVYYSDYSKSPQPSRLSMFEYSLSNPAMMLALCSKIKLCSIQDLSRDIYYRDLVDFNQESLLILFSHVYAIGEEVVQDKGEIEIILQFLAARIDNWLIKKFVFVGQANKSPMPSYRAMVDYIMDKAGVGNDEKDDTRAYFLVLAANKISYYRTTVSLLYKFHNADISEYLKQLPYPLDGFPKLKLKLDPGKRELQKFFNYIASTVFSLPADVFNFVGGFLGVNGMARFIGVYCTSAKAIISIVTKDREVSLLEVKSKTVNLGQITSKEGNGQANRSAGLFCGSHPGRESEVWCRCANYIKPSQLKLMD